MTTIVKISDWRLSLGRWSGPEGTPSGAIKPGASRAKAEYFRQRLALGASVLAAMVSTGTTPAQAAARR